MTFPQFLLGSLALAVVVGGAGAVALRGVPPGGRRPVALLVLGLPPFVLTVATAHLLGRFRTACVLPMSWEQVVTLGLLGMLWGSMLVALAVNLVRLRTTHRLLQGCPALEEPQAVQRLALLAARLKAPIPRLRVLETHSPVALGAWLSGPAVVVSRWFLEHLDGEELEAVMAHELAHLVRRAPQVLWVARVLRDATWYLPWSRRAFELLEAEEELEADALAVALTGRPLALASALGRLTEQALLASVPLPGFGSEPGWMLEERLRRLLEGRARPGGVLVGSLLAGGLAAAALQMVPSLVADFAGALPLYCRVAPS
ncbi:MAG: M56 family metallopeptidase [Armatimonadota bacterium]|nr:M56 family metallopeptidase [Armatimonadota bacterium]MDR7568259.1 M56 family metallopeptidase [Armatimonadota bacterium]MDR7602257.1 M56 family metallopeptidase [Armatimonadota bacterium]